MPINQSAPVNPRDCSAHQREDFSTLRLFVTPPRSPFSPLDYLFGTTTYDLWHQFFGETSTNLCMPGIIGSVGGWLRPNVVAKFLIKFGDTR